MASISLHGCVVYFCVEWLIFILITSGVAQDDVPTPVSIPPSTNWDGNDGPWSSFTVQIGSPPQDVRVLPSSSGSSLWAVVGEGCTKRDPSGCPDSRGGIFNPNSSSTWAEKGLFQLPLSAETAFGYDGNGEFGFDILTLSYNGGGGATINHSVVAGIATKDFYLGTLGLTPYGTNFTDFNHPEPSILKLLRDSGQISSRSWAYTAGAYYTPKKTFGSLLFGGYDTSRFVPNNLTIGLSQDISRDTLVGIQSIKKGDEQLLDRDIIVYIDTTIPHIWLPTQVCENFERIFGLVWNPKVGLYLVNETLHSTLLVDNPTITFTIGSSVSRGETVEIELPYGAFDLEAREILDLNGTSSGTSRYFPLQRAQNDTQYALGRAFLQQAYMIVDYDRNNFSVSQAVFPDTGITERRVPILDPSQTGAANSTSSSSQDRSKSLGTASLVGIVIGIIVVALIAVATALLYIQRRRSHRSRAEKLARANEQPFEKPELDTISSPLPLDRHTELSGENYYVELAGSTRHVNELAGETGEHADELAGDTPAVSIGRTPLDD